MDTRDEFYKKIYDYYVEIATDKIPGEYITGLSDMVTNYYYEQYKRFGKQYPKSIKRYSTLKIDDLDHPSIYEMVINYFKEKLGSNYADFTKILLKKNDLDLQRIEQDIYYYHTK